MAIGLLVAAIPLLHGFDSRDTDLVQAMAAIIIALYWWVQFRIIKSAIHLVRYEQQEAAYTPIKPTPSQTIILAKVWAVLWHHQIFIVLMSLMLLGLSMSIMGFLYYGNFDRGVLQYVGIVTIADHWHYPFLPHAATVALGGGLLLILTVTNSLLSMSIGLWAGRLQKVFVTRFLLLGFILISFCGLYRVSASTPASCGRSYMFPNRCPDILFRNRIVDSLQGLTFTFIDGGASLITGIYCPMGVDFVSYSDERGITQYRVIPNLFGTQFHWNPNGYQTRHLAVVLVTYMSQLVISGFFLWRCISKWKHDNEPST